MIKICGYAVLGNAFGSISVIYGFIVSDHLKTSSVFFKTSLASFRHVHYAEIKIVEEYDDTISSDVSSFNPSVLA